MPECRMENGKFPVRRYKTRMENVTKNRKFAGIKNELKDVWTVVSPMLTIMCVLAVSLSALQTMARIA